MEPIKRRKSIEVMVRKTGIGGKNPVRVQSMTNTDTADVERTVVQIIELQKAGSELVRMTVENEAMAKAVPSIRKRLDDIGLDDLPLIGDFHYNGHLLLTKYPAAAENLDKLRINPGNCGFGQSHDPNFKQIVDVAKQFDKPVRIGVNWGSLDQQVLKRLIDEDLKKSEKEQKGIKQLTVEAVVTSALESAEKAVDDGLEPNKIILSAKTSDIPEFLEANRMLAKMCDYPLHIGVTEAGMGLKGTVTIASGVGILLQDGIGDTIRASLTPKVGDPRANEVHICWQILQSLEIRHYIPQVTSCPGCGRTTNTLFQKIAEDTTIFLQNKMPEWKASGFKGVEEMKVAVMGCIVNGPGESKGANIGLSLPGSGEHPMAPVFMDGKQVLTLQGDNISGQFKDLIEKYVNEHYSKTAPKIMK